MAACGVIYPVQEISNIHQGHRPPTGRAMVCLAVLVLLVFLPVCTGEFVNWDDTHNLLANPRMNPPTLAGVAWYWGHSFKDLYIPVTYTVWSAIATVARTTTADSAGGQGGQLNSYIFHIVNVLMHLGSAILVMSILHRLRFPALTAWCGAAVFAIHPLQVEAVGWVSGLKDVLAGLLGLAAIWLYLAHSDQRQSGRSGRAWAMYLAGAACLVLAMLAKPSAVVVPILVAIIDMGRCGRRPALAIAAAGGWLLTTIPIVIIAKLVQSGASLEYVPPLYLRPLIAADALGFYLRQLLAPIGLTFDYGRSPRWLVGSPQIYFAWLLPAGAAAAGWMLRRRMPELGIGLAVLACGLLPVLGLAPFDYQAYSTVADHYVYLAMLGPAIVVAGILQRYQARPAMMVAMAIIALLAIRSHVQSWAWQDSQSLYASALEVNPDSNAANNNLGKIYADQADMLQRNGQTAAARQFNQRAIPLFQSALKSMPRDYAARKNLGNRYMALGHYPQAEEQFRQAIAIGPRSAELHTALGAMLANQGKLDAAIAEFRLALDIEPNYPPAAQNMEKAMRLRPRP